MSGHPASMECDCPHCEQTMAVRFRGLLVDEPPARVIQENLWFHCPEHGDFFPAVSAVTQTND